MYLYCEHTLHTSSSSLVDQVAEVGKTRGGGGNKWLRGAIGELSELTIVTDSMDGHGQFVNVYSHLV